MKMSKSLNKIYRNGAFQNNFKNMRTYKVSYITLEGDLCHVSIEAYSKEDAKIQLKREYWDVREVVRVTEL